MSSDSFFISSAVSCAPPPRSAVRKYIFANISSISHLSAASASEAHAQSAPWFASKTPQPEPSACAALRASFAVPIGAYSAHGTAPPKSTAWLSVSTGIGARSAAAAVA